MTPTMIVELIAAAYALYMGWKLRITNGGYFDTFIFKMSPIGLSFALVLNAFKVF